MNKKALALACSFALLFGSQSFAQRDWDNSDDRQDTQQQSQQKQNQDRWSDQNRFGDENRLHGGIAKAKKLIGGDIETTRGEDIGDIEDLVADTQKEKTCCVVVTLSGRGTDSNRYVLLPWSIVTPKSGVEDKLIVNVDRDTLRNAPGFDKNHWPDFSTSRIANDVDDYFGNVQGRTGRSSDYSRNDEDNDSVRYRNGDQTSHQNSQSTSGVHVVRLSKVLDTDVQNTARENLGDVQDVAIDPATGKIPYAVLSYGGFLGMGDKWFAVPINALSIIPRNNDPNNPKIDRVVLTMDKQRLKNAPGFDKNHWPDVADARFRSDISAFYGSSGVAQGGRYEDHVGKNRTSADDDSYYDQRSNSRDYSRSMGNTGYGPSVKASQLMRVDVKDQSGKNIGKVQDLVLDPQSGRAFVVLSISGIEGLEDRMLAVPARALEFRQGDRTAYLNVDENRLRRAPTFDKNNWPDVSDARFRNQVNSVFGMEGD
jgi:sporulation protein YlmC with PRC-barrel domain